MSPYSDLEYANGFFWLISDIALTLVPVPVTPRPHAASMAWAGVKLGAAVCRAEAMACTVEIKENERTHNLQSSCLAGQDKLCKVKEPSTKSKMSKTGTREQQAVDQVSLFILLRYTTNTFL